MAMQTIEELFEHELKDIYSKVKSQMLRGHNLTFDFCLLTYER